MTSFSERFAAIERSLFGKARDHIELSAADIADDAVTQAKIGAGAVGTTELADGNVTLGKMAANSVDSDQYVDGSIDTVHLADDAVTFDKLDATAWTAITYASGWADYGGGFQAGQYRKVGDEVQLRGLMKYTTGEGSTTMTTLPVGYRPPANMLFICIGYTGATTNDGLRFTVSTSGTVVLDTTNNYQGDSIAGASVSYIDVCQIRFSVTS